MFYVAENHKTFLTVHVQHGIQINKSHTRYRNIISDTQCGQEITRYGYDFPRPVLNMHTEYLASYKPTRLQVVAASLEITPASVGVKALGRLSQKLPSPER